MATRVREKAIQRKENADKRPSAYLPNVKISVSKVRLVLDQVRGKNAQEALAILTYMPNAAAPIVKKLIASAMANAEVKGMDKDALKVAEIYCTQSRVYNKKLNVRGRGRADVIVKRGSHITVILDQVQA
mgnify:CR=1 FL=1